MPLRFVVKYCWFVIEQTDLGVACNKVLAQSIHPADQSFSISFDKRFGNVEYLLCRPVIIGEHNPVKIFFVIAAELLHILYVGSLEAINALVVVAYNENVWLLPIINQQTHQPVLRSAGILVFINKDILIALLVVEQKIFIGFEFADHPVDHVVEVVTVYFPHHVLEPAEFAYGGIQLYHFFFFIFNLIPPYIASFVFSHCFLRDIFVAVGQIGDIIIDRFNDQFGAPSFLFHGREQRGEIFHFKINITTISFQRMVLWQLVDQLFQKLYFFKLRDGIEFISFK